MAWNSSKSTRRLFEEAGMEISISKSSESQSLSEIDVFALRYPILTTILPKTQKSAVQNPFIKRLKDRFNK
jgi:hypothetical protein